MKPQRRHRRTVTILMTAVALLIFLSMLMLHSTFSHYSELSLQRQDDQLENMAQATDAVMADYLSRFRAELRYVIARRGFANAEAAWHENGSTEDLIIRMQENLITGNPMIHDMLAIQQEDILLSSSGSPDYYFPDGMDGMLKPCFAGDGSMYLALIEDGQYARFAVLVSMDDWYTVLTRTYANADVRLLLLGRQKRILLHSWQGQQCVTLLDDLTDTSCDTEAVRHMLDSYQSGQRKTASYALSYPGDDYVHVMRMTVLPLEECTNGYFVVGLTSDYDEIILPMQSAAWGMMLSSALLVSGVVLMMLMIAQLVRQNRSRDLELDRLVLRTAQTQKLLEQTTELAHHQRLETIGTLTASIAHEFNNLLTPIMGYAILTLEGLPESCDDLADNVTEIYEASRKAKDIISRLNALSRKDPESRFTSLSLSGAAEKALKVAAPAQPSRVTTSFVNQAGECRISGSETQLAQLLLNLILNGYQAMEQTGGCLTLTLRTQDACAVFQVQDEGTGIPEEALPHIFDPFYTTKEPGRGTGLGLAIVRQVLENHHGSITVDSQAGRGSIFTLTLPLDASPADDIS